VYHQLSGTGDEGSRRELRCPKRDDHHNPCLYIFSDHRGQEVQKEKTRQSRAAAVNIIPTTTGAAVATVEVIPSLDGKMEAMALRVPVPDGAITEVVALLKSDVTVDSVNEAFKNASQGELKGILEYSTEEIVSTDILGNRHSSIVDAPSTSVVGGRMVKVMAWYDNEYGYSQRLLELADYIAKNMR